jgi:hypothetical protein
MEQVDEGLWTVTAPLRYAGLQVNTRMSVCRLSDGALALISPIAIGDELQAAIDLIGTVRVLVAPNLLHHLHIGDWIAAYPEARSYAPDGLATKRPDLEFSGRLGPEFDQDTGDDLLRLSIEGMPKLNESLFYHRPSKTLIATDFCFFMPDSTGLTRLGMALMGVHKTVKCDLLFRMMIRDKDAFRRSLVALRTLPIHHLSMCHHSVVSEGAEVAIQDVLQRLKVPEAKVDLRADSTRVSLSDGR